MDCNCEKKIKNYEKKLKTENYAERHKLKSKKGMNLRKLRPTRYKEEGEEDNKEEDKDYYEFESEYEEDEESIFSSNESSSSSSDSEPKKTRTRNKDLFKFDEKDLQGQEPHKIIEASLQKRAIWFLVEMKK
jgi:hypothetical protein